MNARRTRAAVPGLRRRLCPIRSAEPAGGRGACRHCAPYDACIITMEERPVTRSRVIAVIWAVATALAVVITVLFRGDAPGQAAVTVVFAVAGAAMAVWLLVRPSAGGDRRVGSGGRCVADRIRRPRGHPVRPASRLSNRCRPCRCGRRGGRSVLGCPASVGNSGVRRCCRHRQTYSSELQQRCHVWTRPGLSKMRIDEPNEAFSP